MASFTLFHLYFYEHQVLQRILVHAFPPPEHSRHQQISLLPTAPPVRVGQRRCRHTSHYPLLQTQPQPVLSSPRATRSTRGRQRNASSCWTPPAATPVIPSIPALAPTRCSHRLNYPFTSHNKASFAHKRHGNPSC